MNAAIALIFFACVAGSMASDAQSQFLAQLTSQGQAMAGTILNQLQTNILGLVGQAFGHLTGLVSSMGGRFDFNAVLDQFKPALNGIVNQVLGQVLGQVSTLLSGVLGARVDFNLTTIFSDFLASINGAVTGLANHVVNQGLAAVLGNFNGARGLGDMLSALQQQIAGAVTVAQGLLQDAMTNMAALGSNMVEASKPHLVDLQNQLLSHGLNAVESLSSTINNVHGSIVGRR